MRRTPGWRTAPPQEQERLDVEDELDFHLAEREEEYRAAGMTAEQARSLARRRLGDRARVSEGCRAAGEAARSRPAARPPRRGFDMEILWQELRGAVRALVRRPGFALAVLFTLVLGIGASTAVFSVVRGVLLQPLPHPEPEELVLVWEVDQRPGFYNESNNTSAANFLDWQEQNRVFEGMAAYQTVPVTFRGEGDPEQVEATLVSAGFFELLGVEAALGRTFLPEEDHPGRNDAVLLSHRFWQSRLGSDPEIVGKTVAVGSGVYPVIGVLPASFSFLDRDLALFAPLGWSEEQRQNRRAHVVRVLARMKERISIDLAQQEMDRIVDGLRELYPDHLTGWGVRVESLRDAVVGDVQPALLLLSAAVLFVLLVVTVNVVNLTLARSTVEWRETALRSALGASHGRLALQRLFENLLLAILGGGGGLALAALASHFLSRVESVDIPHQEHISTTAGVLVFVAVLSVLSGTIFAGVSLLVTRHRGLYARLREAGPGSTGDRRHQRLRAGFVVSQLAFSLVLLISAGLMISTFARLTAVDPGFEAGGVLTMKLTLPSEPYAETGDQTAFLDRLLQRLDRIPGVETAAVTRLLPLVDPEWTWSVYIEGRERDESEKLDYGRHVTSADYFEAMGIGLRRGRLFSARDDDQAPPVVVVNEAFVRRFFPDGRSPLGRRMSILGEEDHLLEIVGVVEDVHHYALDESPLPAYYIPHTQVPAPFLMRMMNVVLRTSTEPTAMVGEARRAIRELDRRIPVSNVLTMQQRLDHSVGRLSFATRLLTLFALVAVGLALLGIYAVISYSVHQRRRELGVRMALGADGRRIRGEVLAGSLRLVSWGVLFGLAAAVLFTRLQSRLLFGVETLDPLVYGGLTLLLSAAALLASYLPAVRASRVDPLRVLRVD